MEADNNNVKLRPDEGLQVMLDLKKFVKKNIFQRAVKEGRDNSINLCRRMLSAPQITIASDVLTADPDMATIQASKFNSIGGLPFQTGLYYPWYDLHLQYDENAIIYIDNQVGSMLRKRCGPEILRPIFVFVWFVAYHKPGDEIKNNCIWSLILVVDLDTWKYANLTETITEEFHIDEANMKEIADNTVNTIRKSLYCLNNLPRITSKVPTSARSASKMYGANGWDHTTIDMSKVKLTYSNTKSKGGTHASPRLHMRRGHFRTINGKKVWVNAHYVGSDGGGLVTHDYTS